MIKIVISCQELNRTDDLKVVKGSINFLGASLSFSDEWQGFDKFVSFNGYEVDVDNENKTFVPNEALVDANELTISVYGKKDGTLITTDSITIPLCETGFTGSETHIENYKALYEGACIEIELKDSKIEELNSQIDSLGITVTHQEQQIEQLNSQIVADQNTIIDLRNQINSLNEQIDDLDSALDSFASDLETLEEEKERLTNEINAKQNEINALNETIQTLQNEKKAAESTIDKQKNEIETLKNSVDPLNQQIQTLQNEKAQLETDLQNKTVQIETLSSQIESLNSLNQQLQSEKAQLEADKKALQDQVKALQDQLDNLPDPNPTPGITQEEYDAVVNENEALKQNKIDLQNQIDSLNGQISSLDQQIASLDGQITALTQEKADLQGQITTLTQDNQTLQDQITTLQDQITTLTQEKAALQNQIDTWTSNEAALQEQIDTLTNDKATLQSQIDSLTAQIETLNQDKATLQAQIDPLNEQIATLTNEKETLTNQIATLQGQIATLTQEKQALQDQIDPLNQQIETLTNEKSTLSSQVTSLNGQVSDLTQTNRDLEAEVQRLTDELNSQGTPSDALVIHDKVVYSEADFADGAVPTIERVYQMFKRNGFDCSYDEANDKITLIPTYNKSDGTVVRNSYVPKVEFTASKASTHLYLDYKAYNAGASNTYILGSVYDDGHYNNDYLRQVHLHYTKYHIFIYCVYQNANYGMLAIPRYTSEYFYTSQRNPYIYNRGSFKSCTQATGIAMGRILVQSGTFTYETGALAGWPSSSASDITLKYAKTVTTFGGMFDNNGMFERSFDAKIIDGKLVTALNITVWSQLRQFIRARETISNIVI